MMQGITFSQPVSSPTNQLQGRLWGLPSCWLPVSLHPQCQWSETHIPVFLTTVVCFDSRSCLPLHLLGASWAQITLKWTEEWGKYSTQLCLLWGLGPGETCCYAFRYRAGLASEAIRWEPVCMYKNVCLCTKIWISPVVRDGLVQRGSRLDGDKRFLTGSEAVNPGNMAATPLKIKGSSIWRLYWASYPWVNLNSLSPEA